MFFHSVRLASPRPSPARHLFALLLIPLSIAACSESEQERALSEADPSSAKDAPPAAIPEDAYIVTDIEVGRKGGRLVMGMPDEPKTFNPPLITDVLSQNVRHFLFETLYDHDRFHQKDVPRLAKSWEYREATREWVFHLRRGLRWSDGQPLTADDFVFFTEIIFDPSVPNTTREMMQLGGQRYEFSAPDPLTFVAKIPGVDSFALANLIELKAMPRHRYESALKDGTFNLILGADVQPDEVVSSGPLRFKQFVSGEKLVLEANPYYYMFDSAGQRLPYIDELVLLNVPDFDAMALRFQAGDIDIMEDPIQPQNLTVLLDGAARGGYTIHSPGYSLRNVHYWFNLKTGGSYENDEGKRVGWTPPTPGATPPPEILRREFKSYVRPFKQAWFEIDDFRRACSMATNRPAIARAVYFGEATPIYGFVAPANRQWYNPDIPRYPYDPAKAAALLDEIGFLDRDGDGVREDPEGHPIRFTLVTNKENNIREKIGVLLKEDLGKLGFAVTLQLLDFNDILTRLHDSYDYEVCLLGLSSGVPPSPSQAANIWLSSSRMHTFHPNQTTPATPWEARIDELYESLKAVFEYSEQKKIYDEMQYIWADHQGVIHLVSDRLYVGAADFIGNLKPAVLRPYLTHNIAELYIKAR